MIDHEERIANRQGFNEIRIVPEQIVRVADRKQCRNDFQVSVCGGFLNTLDVAEVARIHVAELAELGIGQQHVGVASLCSALKQRLELVDVFIHPKILRAINPPLQRRRKETLHIEAKSYEE